MEFIELLNSKINSFVWGPVMLALLVGTGIYITISTGFLQIFKIKLWIKETFGTLTHKHEESQNVTPFQAVSTALASTVGTGNIAGVATAIVSGGPGAVFWMWVSAFFGMMTKYSEVVLAIHYREKDEKGIHYGGPMYYIEKGLKMKWLAVIFSIFGLMATFGIGNMTQVNSIASAIESNFGVPLIASGVIVALLVALVIVGGIKRISKVTEMIVPFMAVFYFIGAMIVIVMHVGKLPHAFAMIFENAFSFRSVGGGVMGYVIMRGMRYGFARGVFSNEAGLGSAPIAHAASNTNNPVKQGLWGIFEVFVDTIVICSLTALVILTSGLYEAGLSGAALTSGAFASSLGAFGGKFLTVAIIFFAFSTIIGWSYYGENCIKYLFKGAKPIRYTYKAIFIAMVIIGATLKLDLVWDISDTFNGLMAIPNLIALLLLSKVVFSITRDYMKDPESVNMKD